MVGKIQLQDYVFYVPANRDARAFRYRGVWDTAPSSIHVCGAYDPVIDLDAFVVTYGAYRELESLSGDKRAAVLQGLVGLYVMTVATLYHRTGFEDLYRYDPVWLVLGRVVLVIDAEGRVPKAPGVVELGEWRGMGDAGRLELLSRVLGDRLRAQAALEYLSSPRYTGCHLTGCREHPDPWGIVLVIDARYAFPATPEVLRALAGGRRVRKPAWLRPARLIPKAHVLDALMETPALITSPKQP